MVSAGEDAEHEDINFDIGLVESKSWHFRVDNGQRPCYVVEVIAIVVTGQDDTMHRKYDNQHSAKCAGGFG